MITHVNQQYETQTHSQIWLRLLVQEVRHGEKFFGSTCFRSISCNEMTAMNCGIHCCALRAAQAHRAKLWRHVSPGYAVDLVATAVEVMIHIENRYYVFYL